MAYLQHELLGHKEEARHFNQVHRQVDDFTRAVAASTMSLQEVTDAMRDAAGWPRGDNLVSGSLREHNGVTSWRTTPARAYLDAHVLVDPPPVERPRDPDVTHAGHWLWWRRAHCAVCNPPEQVDPDLVARLERELLDTSPQQWARDACDAFDEEHRVRQPGEKPLPPRPDRGERSAV